MLILPLSGAAALSKIERIDSEHLIRFKTHFTSFKKSANIHLETELKQTQIPQCVYGASAHLIESRCLATGTIVRRPLKIDRVASSGCDREVAAAALPAVRKRRYAQLRNDLPRSFRQCTLVKRETRTAHNETDGGYDKEQSNAQVTCCASLLLSAGDHAAVRLNCFSHLRHC